MNYKKTKIVIAIIVFLVLGLAAFAGLLYYQNAENKAAEIAQQKALEEQAREAEIAAEKERQQQCRGGKTQADKEERAGVLHRTMHHQKGAAPDHGDEK